MLSQHRQSQVRYVLNHCNASNDLYQIESLPPADRPPTQDRIILMALSLGFVQGIGLFGFASCWLSFQCAEH
jgi:hypothetical protein